MKQADQTRESIISAAYEEMWAQGFRSASIDKILRRTGVTKGALYHHFPNKANLGHAVIDEMLRPQMELTWAQLRDPSLDPIDSMLRWIEERVELADTQSMMLGCPVNHLVQEMGAIDEEFRARLEDIQSGWRDALETALDSGQQRGLVRKEVNATQAATFLVASYSGCMTLAKSSRSKVLFAGCMAGMADYVRQLRPQTSKE
ncbi:MAG: TetR/AcrR family transcriptional regulator [Pseudomonadota bacterium]